MPTIRKICALSPAIASASRAWPVGVDVIEPSAAIVAVAEVVARDLGAGAAEDQVRAGRAAGPAPTQKPRVYQLNRGWVSAHPDRGAAVT